MLYPGYEPNTPPRVLHYGLKFNVGGWHFDKSEWREQDMTNNCWAHFPNPPAQSTLPKALSQRELDRDTISIECVQTLNEALQLHHAKRGCRKPQSIEEKPTVNTSNNDSSSHKALKVQGEEVKAKGHMGSVKRMLTGKSEKLRSIPTLISPRIWMVGLWTLLVSLFLLIVSTLFSRNKAAVQRQRKARPAHRYSRSGDVPSEDLTA